MDGNLFVQLAKTLKKKEQRALQRWARSPFHNQRDDIIDLFAYLFPSQIHKPLTKEGLFSAIYPKETYDDARLRQLFHFALKTLEAFLTYVQWSDQTIEQDLILTRIYRERHIEKGQKSSMSRALRNLDQQPIRNYEYLNQRYQLAEEEYLRLVSTQRNKEYNLQEVSDLLDHRYLAEKLRVACLLMSHQTVFPITYDFGLLPLIESHIGAHINEEEQLAIGMYYSSYRALKSPELDTFQQTKRLLRQAADGTFPTNELSGLYRIVLNFCIRKMNRGETDYIREAFDLYKSGFEHHILITDEGISRWTFLNVVFIAVRLKEWDWTQHFIEEYQHHIEEGHRENFVHFSKARLTFVQGDYKATMQRLYQAEYKDPLLMLLAKSMLMKIYYEEGEVEVLESLLESTRAYLQRKKIQGFHRDNYSNLVRLLKKLLRLPLNDRDTVKKLRKEIEETNPLTEKEWLLAQLSS